MLDEEYLQGIPYKETLPDIDDNVKKSNTKDLFLNLESETSYKCSLLDIPNIDTRYHQDNLSESTVKIITKRDKENYFAEVREKLWINSGITDGNERLDSIEIGTKFIKHSDARWGDTVSIANVISPHLIFVKHRKNLCDKLTFDSPGRITQIQWIDDNDEKQDDPKRLSLKNCIGYYVLAPLEKGVYARARIIDANDDRTFMKIIFIDYGTITWVSKDCLAVLDIEFFKYRWQVRPISLANIGLYPVSNDLNGEEKWEKEHIDAVKEILSNCKVVQFNHYKRLKRIYANEITPVVLYEYIERKDDFDVFANDNLLEDYNNKLTSINDLLVARFGHLFHEMNCENLLGINMIDISDECDIKLNVEDLPLWKKNFLIDDILSIENMNVFENDIDETVLENWNYDNLKKEDLIYGSAIYGVLQRPIRDTHFTRFGLIPFKKNELIKFIENREEGRNELSLLSQFGYMKETELYEKLREYGKGYRNVKDSYSVSLNDILLAWKDNKSYYVTLEYKLSNNEFFFLRAEVIGFTEEENKLTLIKIRFLDVPGVLICHLHEVLKLTEVMRKDKPFSIGFICNKFQVRNCQIRYDDPHAESLVNETNKLFTFSEPVMININDKCINKGNVQPSIEVLSKYPQNIADVLRSDFVADYIYKISGLEDKESFSLLNINFETLMEQKGYEKLFKYEPLEKFNSKMFYTRSTFGAYIGRQKEIDQRLS
uniref:Tudor domain-containing protein n=1 Tax=Parastrongyloides trichosuri TaxID=131310 RepID=A0A0N4Z6Q7_PARTI